jgi:hypothetical protein
MFDHGLRNTMLPYYMLAERPMAELQRLAARVWVHEGGQRPRPAVVAGRGDRSRCDMWEDGTAVIVLSRGQRCIYTLLHEIAHALGTLREADHGPTFTERLLFLYGTYGRANPIDLYCVALESRVL